MRKSLFATLCATALWTCGSITSMFGWHSTDLLSLTATAHAQTQTSTTNSPATTSAKLRADYLASTDHRSFVQQALQRPSEGGYHYAFLALIDCIRWDSHKTQASASSSLYEILNQKPNTAALQGQAKIAARCAAFKEDEALRLFISTRYERSLTDPLMNARLDMQDMAHAIKVTDPTTQLYNQLQARLQQLQRLQDPTLPTHQLFAQAVVNATLDETLWLDGVRYGNATGGDQPNRRAIESMIELAVCNDDANCSIARNMRETCAILASCTQSPLEFMREQYVQVMRYGSQAQFDAALKLLPAIKTHIAQANVLAFLPPQGSAGPASPTTAVSMQASAFRRPGLSQRNATEINFTEVAPLVSKMRATFLASTDYRSFLLHALQRPQEGGYEYAQQALQRCRSAQLWYAHTPLRSVHDSVALAKAYDAQHKLGAPCAGMKREESGQILEMVNMQYGHLRSQDPLLIARTNMYKVRAQGPEKTSMAQLEAAFTTLRELQDPMLKIDELIAELSMTAQGWPRFHGDMPPPFFFKGKAYEDFSFNKNPDSAAVQSVLQLAVCELQGSCRTSDKMLEDCISWQQCERPSLQLVIRDNYLRSKPGSEQQFDAALQLLPQMKEEIQKGNLRAFLPRPNQEFLREPAPNNAMSNWPPREIAVPNIAPTYTAPKQSASTRRASASAKMRAEYYTSRDHHALIVQALNKPQEGGFYYAYKALGQCSTSLDYLIRNFKPRDVNYEDPRRSFNNSALYALKAQRDPCQSDQFNALSKRIGNPPFYERSNLNKDPLMRSQHELIDVSYQLPSTRHEQYESYEITPQLTEKFDAVFQLNDPGHLVESLTKFAAGRIGNRGIWFNGTRFASSNTGNHHVAYVPRKTADGQYLPYAETIIEMMQLAVCDHTACELGGQLLLGCTSVDRCVIEHVYQLRKHNTYNAMNASQTEMALKLLPQIKAAIQAGDLKAFMPPQKK